MVFVNSQTFFFQTPSWKKKSAYKMSDEHNTDSKTDTTTATASEDSTSKMKSAGCCSSIVLFNFDFGPTQHGGVTNLIGAKREASKS